MPDTAQTTEATDGDRQAALRAFIARRHPDYDCMAGVWEFMEDTYEGGRDWFNDGNVFQYVKEGKDEYEKRVQRAYRFNHTREVVDLVQKYIFKSEITRNETDAPDEVKEFWDEATLSGLSVTQFAKQLSTEASKFGMIWVVVDSNKKAEALSVADAKAQKARVYSYVIKPQDALDMGFDELGELNWFLAREYKRDDTDPIYASGAVKEQFRLWKKDGWELYEIQEDPEGDVAKAQVVLVGEGSYSLNRVPIFAVKHVVNDAKYSCAGLISDIAYLDRAVANYLSNLDAIIQDQTFSQLVMPAQGLQPGTDPYKQMVEMGTKRMFVYDGEGGVAPEFISPDPRQANIILVVINKIINEIYHTIGMAGERTKEDNAVGIDNSSGVAKAYDFERMNSLLTSKADALEDAENKLVEIVLAWYGKTLDEKIDELVQYPDTFDVLSLFDEITIAERLALIDAPAEVRREQMKQVITKIFPRLAADLKKTIEDGLQSWPPTLDLMVTATAGSGDSVKFPAKGVKTGGATSTTNVQASPKGDPAAKNAKTQKRQGQVTSETK